MALCTLLALLGSAGLYVAAQRAAGPRMSALAQRRIAIRVAALAFFAAGAAAAMVSEGPGIGLTLFVLVAIASFVSLALALPLWPRLAWRVFGLTTFALAAATIGAF